MEYTFNACEMGYVRIVGEILLWGVGTVAISIIVCKVLDVIMTKIEYSQPESVEDVEEKS